MAWDRAVQDELDPPVRCGEGGLLGLCVSEVGGVDQMRRVGVGELSETERGDLHRHPIGSIGEDEDGDPQTKRPARQTCSVRIHHARCC